MGYRGSGDTLQREEFEARKKAVLDIQKAGAPAQLASSGKNVEGSPLLQALASREELVRSGKLTTIIFIRDIVNQEVSGYIDYAHRLKQENFEVYFDRKAKASVPHVPLKPS